MQTGAEPLIKIDERLHRLFLADDLFSQRLLEVASCRTTLFRVQNSREPVICTVFQVRTGFSSMGGLRRCDHNCLLLLHAQVSEARRFVTPLVFGESQNRSSESFYLQPFCLSIFGITNLAAFAIHG